MFNILISNARYLKYLGKFGKLFAGNGQGIRPGGKQNLIKLNFIKY